jgi:hypothetical protein
MAENVGRKYLDRLKALEDEQTEWIPHMQDITNYILPRKGKYLARGQKIKEGEVKNQKIVDGTATRALRVLSAGMQGGLTSPARPWFRLALQDTDLMEFGPVKDWLTAIEKIMYGVFSQSNFYSSVHSVYTELGGFGTACLFLEEDLKNIIHFRVMTAGEYSLANDSKGRVDTVYRRFWMTARNIIKQFGAENVSTNIKQDAEKNPLNWYEIVHAIQPNNDRDIEKVDNQNFPYESVYLEYAKDEKLLSKSGYEEFPCMCPRWDTTASEVYGRSPGMDVLPDVKMLQSMSESKIKLVHKIHDPPLNVPSSLHTNKVSLIPGTINPIDPNAQNTIEPTVNVNPAVVPPVLQDIEDLRVQIREGLFNDLFLMITGQTSNQPISATEVLERKEEKLLMLGPVIERQFFELLDPLIERTFNILGRRGFLPPPPPEIGGAEMKVEYISLLAQAQKLAGTQGIGAFVDFVGQLSTIKPEVLDKINGDQTVEEYAEMIGVTPTVVNSEEEALVIRQVRVEQQQRQQQLELLNAGVEGAKTLSETDTEGKNALTDLTNTLEGNIGQ